MSNGNPLEPIKSKPIEGIDATSSNATNAFITGNINISPEISKGKEEPLFESINAPQFGESKYDDPNTPLSLLKTPGAINELRAKQQGIGTKLGNDAVKFLGSAVQSASGVVSLPVGIYESIRDNRFASLYDNTITRPISDLNKLLDEHLPTYYTKAELESKNPLKGIIPGTEGSQNFWFDKIGKNLGYTIGAIGEGAVLTKFLSNIGKLTEAEQLTKVGELVDKYVGQGIEETKATVQAIDEVAKSVRRTDKAISVTSAMVSSTGEASNEGQSGLDEGLKSMIQKYKDTHNGKEPDSNELGKMTSLNEAAANVRFGINIPLLTSEYLFNWGKLFSTAKDEEVNIGKTVFNDITGLYEKAVISKGEKLIEGIGKIAKMPLAEGAEEISQFITEKGTANYAQRKYDNPSIDTIDNLLKSTVYGFSEGFGTKEGWENFLLGAITGGISGIHPSSELRTQLKEIGEIDSNTSEAINKLNEYKKSDNYKVKFDSAVRDAAIQVDKDANLKSGNKFEWKNNQFDQFKNFVQSRIESGKFDLVKEELNKMLLANDEDFKNTFGIPKEGNEKLASDYVNNLINQSESIKKIYDNINTVYGNKFNKNVTEHLFDLASNIEDRNNRINKLSTQLGVLTNGRLTFAPYGVEFTQQEVDEHTKQLNENLKNWKEDTTLNPAEVKANEKKIKENKLIEDLHKLHNDRINTIKEFRQVSSKDGLEKLDKGYKEFQKNKDKEELDAFKAKVINENLDINELEKIKKVVNNKPKEDFIQSRISELKTKEAVKKAAEQKKDEGRIKEEERKAKQSEQVSKEEKDLEDKILIPGVVDDYKNQPIKEKLPYLKNALEVINKKIKSEGINPVMTSLKNYYEYQLNKLEIKPKEEVIIDEVSKFESDEILQEGEQPIEVEEENQNQINLFIPDIQTENYTNLNRQTGIKKIGTRDIVIKDDEVANTNDFLLNKLKIGDDVTISIDTENEDYNSVLNDKNLTEQDKINQIPVKIESKGKKIMYSNKISYLNSEIANIDKVINYFTGKTQDEVDEFFTKTFDNGELLLQLLDLEETDENLIHIKKILYFGKKKVDANTKFNIQQLDESLKAWKLKISKDLIGGLTIRKELGLNISKVLKSTISNKTSGSVIFNTDKEGKPIYKKVTDSFDENVILLRRPLNDEDGHTLIPTTENIEYKHRYHKNIYEKGKIYIGVETAQIFEDGTKKLIPIQLKTNTLNKAKSEKLVDKVISLIENIGDLLTEQKSLADPQLNKFRSQLAEIVVVSEKDNRKLKINDDSIEFYNGVDKIEIWYQHKEGEVKVPNKKPVLNINGQIENYSKLASLLQTQERAVSYWLLDENRPYKDALGKQWGSYKEYLFEDEILLTNVGKLTDKDGNKISNVFGRGQTPMVVHINSNIKIDSEIIKSNESEQSLTEFTKSYSDKYKWLYKLAEDKGTTLGETKDLPANAYFIGNINKLGVTEKFSQLSQESKERVIAHEVIHSLLKDNMTPEVKTKLVDFIKTLPQTNDERINEILVKIGEDTEELITYASTNKEFANWLNSQKVEGEVKKSLTLWGKLKQLIREVLEPVVGKTKLDELNELLDDILKLDVLDTQKSNSILNRRKGGNDIKLENQEGLKFEAGFESSYKNPNLTKGFTSTEQSHILNVLSNAFLRYEQRQNEDIDLDDKKLSLKEKISNILIDTYADNINPTNEQTDLISRTLDDLEKEDSNLWKKLKSYLLKKNGIKINNIDDYTSIEDSDISKEWDDKKEFEKNIADTVNNDLKKFISTIPIIDPLSMKIDKDGNVTYKKNTNTLSGIAETLKFNSVYPYLYNQMIGSLSTNEMMDRLLTIGVSFDPTFLELRNQIMADEDLLAMFWSGFSKFAPNRLIELFKQRGEKYKIDMDYGNKNTNAINIISNEWVDNINKRIDSDIFDNEYAKKYKEINDRLNPLLDNFNKNKTKIIEDTNRLFGLLNIDIHDNLIKFTIENPIRQNEIKGKDKEELLYNKYFKSTLGNLETYIKNKKLDNKTKFDQYGALNRLAELEKGFKYDKVNNTSRTVDNTNVYNIQNSSFLSSFKDLLKNKTEEGKKQFNKILEDYAKDKSLETSYWLDKLTNDEDFRNNFDIDLYEGGKNVDINKGQEYTDINDSDWELKKYLWFLDNNNRTKNNPNSIRVPLLSLADKGTMYFIQTEKIAVLDSDFDLLKLSRESELWKTTYNTFLQEKSKMDIAKAKLFNTDLFGNIIGVQEGLDNKSVVKNYHFSNFDENDNPIYLDKDNKPTGNVFKFHNMDIIAERGNYYTDDNGKYIDKGQQVTMNNIPRLKINGIHLDSTFNEEMNNKVKNFIDEFINQEVKKETIFANNIRTTLEGKYNHIGTFNTMLHEFVLNQYIANIEQQNLFFGNTSLYKNSDDGNKRAPQVTAMGINRNIEGSFNAITIKSIKLKSNNAIRNKEEISKLSEQAKEINNILLKYESEINDAVSYITLDEYYKRLVGQGEGRKYKELYNNLKNNLPVNEKSLIDFMNPLKEFYFGMNYDNLVGFTVPVQVKNATGVLIKQYIKGSQLEQLYDIMMKDKIHQVNVESATKSGTKDIMNIADKDGNILQDKLDNLKTIINPLYYKDLRLQLDVPDHIRDEHNKKGIQITKNILNNINDSTIYNIGDYSLTGKEIKDTLFDLEHENIKESAYKLLKRLGVKFDKEGNPIENDKGFIDIDEEKLKEILESEIESRGLSDNFKDAIQLEEIGGKKFFSLPLYYSTMASKYEAILTSLFSNNITNQKFPGGHVAMLSGAFTGKASDLTQDKQEITKDTFGIQWSKEIIDRNDYTLKSMTYIDDNTSVLSAEVLLPAWSKQFFDKDGKVIDIDNLPEEIRTMIGYRIPTETKHSMIVFKVVGFLSSTQGSVMVLPNDFVTQSGADFDIDSIYIMQPNFIKNKDDKFEKIKYDNSESLSNNTREQRENKILDIYSSILRHPSHFKEIVSPSSFKDITSARDNVNKILGKSKFIINRSTNSGNRTYRNRGLEGRDLKGSSVSRDGFLSIASVSKMELRPDLGIIQKYSLDDIRLDDLETLKQRFPKHKIYDNHLYIFHNKIGWTSNNDFKNVSGELVSDYTSQTTANILDIIKDPIPENINTYNFAIMKSFPDIGILFDEMVLFASQPILKDLSKLHYKSISLLEDNRNDKKIIEQVKRTYQTRLYNLLKKNGKKPINSYEIDLQKEGTIKPKRERIQSDLGYSPNLPTLENIEGNKFEYISKHGYEDLLKESIKGVPNTKAEIDNRIDYLRKQLQILEMFVVYKKTGEAFSDGLKVFNTDKKSSSPTLDTFDTLNNNIEKITDYKQDKGKGARLLIDGEAATKKIYPKFFDKNSTDKSSYRMLESYYDFSNSLASKSLSNLFINTLPSIKSLSASIKSNININTNNSDLINRKINTFINVHLLNDLPYFSDLNKKGILGIEGKYDLKLDISNLDNIEIFKTLSVANQLDLVKDQFIKKSKFGIEQKKYYILQNDLSHILNYLESKTDAKSIESKGYETINYLTNDKDDDMTESFNNMWSNENPYLRVLAQNLLKQTFITSGLTFGQNSLGKIIPTNILIEDFNDSEYPKGIELGVHLRNKFNYLSNNPQSTFSQEFIDYFYRQNHNNSDIVPFVQTDWIIDNEGKKVINSKKVKWFPNKEGIIVVNNELLEKGSKTIEKASIVKVKIKDNTILYKNYKSDEDVTYFYPVSKLEPFEYTEKSYLDKNNINIDKSNNDYETIIDNYINEDFKYEEIEGKPFPNITNEEIEEQIKKCK